MPFRVSGKNIDIGEALRERVSSRVADAVGKYFDGGGYSGHVTIDREAFGFRTEAVVHLASGVSLQANAIAADAYASADQAAAHIEKRLRRYHRRLKDHHSAARRDGKDLAAADETAPSYVIATPDHEQDDEGESFSPVVVAESAERLRRLAVSEAVIELDMTGTPVLIFRHAATGRVNVVYRRSDGNIGWIDPPGAAPDAH